MRSRGTSWWISVLLVIIGGFIGNIAGEILANAVPLANDYMPIGFDPTPFNLAGVLSITIGMTFNINLVGGIGMVAGLILSRR